MPLVIVAGQIQWPVLSRLLWDYDINNNSHICCCSAQGSKETVSTVNVIDLLKRRLYQCKHCWGNPQTSKTRDRLLIFSFCVESDLMLWNIFDVNSICVSFDMESVIVKSVRSSKSHCIHSVPRALWQQAVTTLFVVAQPKEPRKLWQLLMLLNFWQ